MAMIQDVDESLRALVKRDALNGSKADVAFDAPTKEWSSRRNTPTIDLYLYDIREDLEQREVMWEDIRGDSRDPRLITERRPPPRRFKLSYLVTAWTSDPRTSIGCCQRCWAASCAIRSYRPTRSAERWSRRGNRSCSTSRYRRPRTAPSPTYGRRWAAS